MRTLIVIICLLLPTLALGQTHTMPGSNVVPSGASLTIQSGATITAAAGSTVTGFGVGGGAVSLTATAPIVVTPSPITGTGVVSITQGTNGQLLVGQTGSAPLWKTITGDLTVGLTGAAAIPNDTIHSYQILDGAVQYSKIQNVSANSKLLGSNATGSGAPPGEITLGTGLTMSTSTLTVGGTNVGTFLATPSSANLRSALTDENGTGVALFDSATSPTFTTPKIVTNIQDTNAKTLLGITATASAVNNLVLANAAATGGPTLSTAGTDTDINLNVTPKGAGRAIFSSTGNAQVQAGATIPVYFINNSPNVGLNAYYNAGWKYGAGSAAAYAGTMFLLHSTTGEIGFQISSVAGNADAAIGTFNLPLHLFPSRGVQVGNNTPLDPGADNLGVTGYVDSTGGYKVAGAAASGKILQGNGTIYTASTPTWPTAAGAVGYTVRSDATNFASFPAQLINSSVAAQSPSTSDVYLTGSNIVVTAGDMKAKGQYKCVFDMSKTAGTGAIVITLRVGTAGTTSDAAIQTYTFGAGTSVSDLGIFEVIATWRTVGSGTSAVMQGMCRGTHQLATTGLFNNAAGWIVLGSPSPSSGFNSSTATNIGISFNGSTAFAGTSQLVQAQLQQ